ncbi:MAG: sugar phosphate isomerase/epimerase [Ruminococcaceae bacterium]|nr:sugar phosphate isomerase/epimerase [Oscillospiraceae bacterium]
MMNMKIGLSTCGKEINEELFSSFRSAGIECMEISMPNDKHDSMDFGLLDSLSRRYDVEIWSYHLPFHAFKGALIDMSALERDKRKYTLDYYSDIIKKGTNIGIEKFVIHPSCGPIEEDERMDRLNFAKETHMLLSEIASKEGATICVENLPRHGLGNTSDELMEIVNCDERLKICLDTNHFLKEDVCESVKKLAHKIVTLHVSDYDMIDERHWLPGEGKICWNKLYNNLKDYGYSGPWLYEVGYVSKTRKRQRLLSPPDYVRNANEIFGGGELSVIPSELLI